MIDFPVKGDRSTAILYDIYKDVVFPNDFKRYSFPNEVEFNEAVQLLRAVEWIKKKPPREGRYPSGRKKIICRDCGYEITSKGIEALQKSGVLSST